MKGHSKSVHKGMSKVNSKPKGFGKSMKLGYAGKSSGVSKSSTGAPVPMGYAQQQRAVQRATARAIRVTMRGR